MRQNKFILAVLAASFVIAAQACAGDADPLDEKEIDRRIKKHRTSEITLTVTDSAGEPLAGSDVTVRQVRHKFLFGCNAFQIGRIGDDELHGEYKKKLAAVMNYATLPFYWGGYERRRGETQQQHVMAMARWCGENDIVTKGHPLCWHNVAPRWLKSKPPEQVEKLQMSRIRREVKAFAGAIDMWDVVNEAVVMPRYRDKFNPIRRLCEKIGRVGLIAEAFGAARKVNPRATLLLNDFDVSDRYAKLIRECLRDGVAIDAIGIQSHMHGGYWGAEKAWGFCEKFSVFEKPIHFTELTILSGPLKTDDDWNSHHPGWETTDEGETRQAKQAVEFYSVLFSHPSVEAITWWNLSDFRSWQGAPAGLLRKDMSPKPAYEQIRKLIRRRWWTGPLNLKTDSRGRVKFRGYLGEYEIKSGWVRGSFRLERKGAQSVGVKLKSNRN